MSSDRVTKDLESFGQGVLVLAFFLSFGCAIFLLKWKEERLTLIVAIVTLCAVAFQIRIANRQLAQADVQLGLAREELGVIKEDLKFSREQSDFINRRADIVVRANVIELPSPVAAGSPIDIKLYFFNRGTKTLTRYKLTIGIPNFHQLSRTAGLNSHWYQDGEVRTDREYSGYRFFSKIVTNVLFFPKQTSLMEELYLEATTPLFRSSMMPVLWRISHDDALQPAYPGDYYRCGLTYHELPESVSVFKSRHWDGAVF